VPFLYDGVAQVELPNDPNYHFMTDMTEKARAWIKYQKALTPDKPSFIYFAPGATHAPHHVPQGDGRRGHRPRHAGSRRHQGRRGENAMARFPVAMPSRVT
jgi:arylsulfatase A-like enzyme